MFLTQESADTPMHIGLLMFYTPPKGRKKPVRFKEILATFEQRAACAPIFHRRLGRVPLGIDHPFWLDDEQLDMEFHVRHIGLPSPGGFARVLKRSLCSRSRRVTVLVLTDRSLRIVLWRAVSSISRR